MAARYVDIGQFPDIRREIRGTLAEILVATANPGTYACPEDVTGCFLEMGTDGKWVGDLGAFDSFAALGALPKGNLAVGAQATAAGVSYTYQGGVGWVDAIASRIRYRRTKADPFEVMASQPTVSISTTHDSTLTQMFRATAPGSAASAYTQVSPSPFTFVKSHKITYSASTQQWDDPFVTSKAVQISNSSRGAGIFGVRFEFIGTSLEIMVSGNNQKHRLKITENGATEGRYVSLTPTQSTNSGSYNYIKIVFSSFGTRIIELQQQNATGAGFGGVYTDATASILPANSVGPRILIAGDSFTEGSGSLDAGLSSYVQAVSDCLGIDDVCMSGVGGTGYIATSGGSKPKFRDRLQADVLDIPHDACFFAFGINDYYDVPTALSEAELCINAYLANPPGKLGIISPFFTGSTMRLPAAFLSLYRGLKALAAKYSLEFVDLVQMPISSDIPALTATLTASIAANGTTITTQNALAGGTTWEFPDGTLINIVSNSTGSTGSKTNTLPFGIATAQSAGTVMKLVGNGFWTGNGRRIDFTASLSAATSGTLTSAWAGVSGAYTIGFSDGSTRSVTLTNGSTAVSWTGAVTASSVAYAYSGFPGNSSVLVSSDGTHPSPDGHVALGSYLAIRISEILARWGFVW